MRRLQKYKGLMNKGKLENKEPVGKPKSVIDSVTTYLLRTANELQTVKGIQNIIFWEDCEEAEAARVEAEKLAAAEALKKVKKEEALLKKEAALKLKEAAIAEKEEALALQKIAEAAKLKESSTKTTK